MSCRVGVSGVVLVSSRFTDSSSASFSLLHHGSTTLNFPNHSTPSFVYPSIHLLNDPNIVSSVHPYRQRPGGKPDDSDLKSGPGAFLSGLFGKKEPEPEVEDKPKTNWWTL